MRLCGFLVTAAHRTAFAKSARRNSWRNYEHDRITWGIQTSRAALLAGNTAVQPLEMVRTKHETAKRTARQHFSRRMAQAGRVEKRPVFWGISRTVHAPRFDRVRRFSSFGPAAMQAAGAGVCAGIACG